MRVAIMQPYFFPYLGYFQLINAVDTFVIYDDVNFINRGWINRNNILVNNNASLITVPLKEASQNKLINELQVVDDPKWRSKLLKSIEFAYKKAPLFNQVFPVLETAIRFNETNLSLFLFHALKQVLTYLEIETVLKVSSVTYANRQLKGMNRIIDICIKEKATQYINPIGGIELYNKDHFIARGIELSFIKTGDVYYNQFIDDFVPNLSIIDFLMFNSKESIKNQLSNYKLI